jgi:hypothetical protein
VEGIAARAGHISGEIAVTAFGDLTQAEQQRIEVRDVEGKRMALRKPQAVLPSPLPDVKRVATASLHDIEGDTNTPGMKGDPSRLDR